MIFSVGDHIKQIMAGTKTQTRRKSEWYQVGKTYSIQPVRTKPAISEGRIMIIFKTVEYPQLMITREDALAEGGYKPEQFEALYREMHPDWAVRYAYQFSFVPTVEAED